MANITHNFLWPWPGIYDLDLEFVTLTLNWHPWPWKPDAPIFSERFSFYRIRSTSIISFLKIINSYFCFIALSNFERRNFLKSLPSYKKKKKKKKAFSLWNSSPSYFVWSFIRRIKKQKTIFKLRNIFPLSEEV